MADGWEESRMFVMAAIERSNESQDRLAASIESLGRSVAVLTNRQKQIDSIERKINELEKTLSQITTKVAVLGATAGGAGLAAFEGLRALLGS